MVLRTRKQSPGPTTVSPGCRAWFPRSAEHVVFTATHVDRPIGKALGEGIEDGVARITGSRTMHSASSPSSTGLLTNARLGGASVAGSIVDAMEAPAVTTCPYVFRLRTRRTR